MKLSFLPEYRCGNPFFIRSPGRGHQQERGPRAFCDIQILAVDGSQLLLMLFVVYQSGVDDLFSSHQAKL